MCFPEQGEKPCVSPFAQKGSTSTQPGQVGSGSAVFRIPDLLVITTAGEKNGEPGGEGIQEGEVFEDSAQCGSLRSFWMLGASPKEGLTVI